MQLVAHYHALGGETMVSTVISRSKVAGIVTVQLNKIKWRKRHLRFRRGLEDRPLKVKY